MPRGHRGGGGVRGIEDGGGMVWYAAARATMTSLPSGRLIERPASLLERHQMATFQKLNPEPLDSVGQEALHWLPDGLANGVSRTQWGTPVERGCP